MYQGVYGDKRYHEPDLAAVLERAWAAGVERIIVTGGSLEGSRAALALARTDRRLFSTVGVHPTHSGDFDAHAGGADVLLAELRALLEDGRRDGKVVAVGEIGLDYDRLHFCDAAAQRRGFEAQLGMARAAGLPLFLHMRAAAADFVDIMRRHHAASPGSGGSLGGRQVGGVVHSFTGTVAQLGELLALQPQLAIGVNGCSLKTEENLAAVAAIPMDRLLIETDSPWCWRLWAGAAE
ncbi:hypothetical protein WJX81_001539 [Elliptochloris bilobata]|uniref:Uncharacterized protein n=1 Tax=Elliptochloris bilobata TaxID=381761 RepID=A0AAW1RIF1_9CHLO